MSEQTARAVSLKSQRAKGVGVPAEPKKSHWAAEPGVCVSQENTGSAEIREHGRSRQAESPARPEHQRGTEQLLLCGWTTRTFVTCNYYYC